MMKLKHLGLCVTAGLSMNTMAADFSFDRPGSGMGTGITPVGQLAWEQGLANANYVESTTADGEKVKTTNLNADMLFRTGLAKNIELQLGWAGPSWQQVKVAGNKSETDGLGDVSVGVKAAIPLDDERLSMAVLAEAVIATGNDGFTNEDDIYSLTSAVSYDYSDLVTTSITMRYEVQNSDWAISAIPTLEYQFTDKLSGFSELVYRKAESQDNEYALGTGLMYAVNQRMQLDASVGVDLDGSDKSYYSALGISYLF